MPPIIACHSFKNAKRSAINCDTFRRPSLRWLKKSTIRDKLKQDPIMNEVLCMRVSYKKLWVMLAEREMSKVELRKLAGISPATFTKLRRNQEVALSVLLKIAEALDCDAGEMMSFVRDDSPIGSDEQDDE